MRNYLFILVLLALTGISTCLYGQKYTRLIPGTKQDPRHQSVVPNYGSLLQTALNTIDQAQFVNCARKKDQQLTEKISQERAKLQNNSKEFLVIADWEKCQIQLIEYKGTDDVLAKEGATLDVYIIELIPFLSSPKKVSNFCNKDFRTEIIENGNGRKELLVTPVVKAPCNHSPSEEKKWKVWGVLICYKVNGEQKVARQDMTYDIVKDGNFTYGLSYSKNNIVSDLRTTFFDATLPSNTYPEKVCN